MKWIGYITDKNYDLSNKSQQYGLPATYIIKRFFVGSSFKKVKIKIAALGVYSLYINGQLINNEFMSQDLSEYESIIYYRLFDVTKHIQNGLNTLGIILADGWYASNLSIKGKNIFGEYPLKVAFEIYVDNALLCYSDGSEMASSGPIRSCDNQNGINIDNNYEIVDFGTNECDISNFQKVELFEVRAKIKKSLIKPIVLQKVFKPRLVCEYDNHHIYDFGQNFAGVTHTIFTGNKNSKIEILHAELLINDRKLYIENLRSALAKDTYILSGKSKEEFLPRHTYHGFRYVDIVYDNSVSLDLLEGIAFWSKMKRTGYIRTNNNLINQIYSNVLWSQRSNFLSIPTDCPQRDERMGWTGDAQIFTPSASFNYDTNSFLSKYVLDICCSSKLYKHRTPVFVPFFHKDELFTDDSFDWKHDSLGWSDAIISIPLNLYLYFGNKKILKKSFPYMKRFIEYIEKHRIVNGVYNGHSFGDWLSVYESVDLDLFNVAYLANDYKSLSKVCEILNDKSEAKYINCFNKTKELFRQKFWRNNKLSSDTQGAYILAYSFGLINKDECKTNLIRKIEEYGHITTGFHSTKYLFNTLCEIGYKDLAYKLLNSKEYPSLGYMVDCGATTIWERWDSYKKETGANKDGMNSFNHYSLGSVTEWMYKSMTGISPEINNPGFKVILVSPYFDKKVNKLKSSLKTINGKISVDYVIENNIITYHISADKRIDLDFEFNNEIISKRVNGVNDYTFDLKY